MTATKADVEAHFNSHGTGEITEIKLMNGFGFIEYKDALDARDVVPGKSFFFFFFRQLNHLLMIIQAFHGSEFMGERLTVQFARGSRSREAYANTERTAPRPRRTPHRMQISGLPGETSWQVRPSFPFFALDFWISLSLLDDQHKKLDASSLLALKMLSMG